MLLISLNPNFKNKCEILKYVSDLLENKELFNEDKFEFFQAIIQLEIKNLLTNIEQNQIKEAIKMTPRAMAVVTKAIKEVNLKVLAETREDALVEASERIAKSLKDKVNVNDLAQATGLSVEEIKRL